MNRRIIPPITGNGNLKPARRTREWERRATPHTQALISACMAQIAA